jgi:hypothetical protein
MEQQEREKVSLLSHGYDGKRSERYGMETSTPHRSLHPMNSAEMFGLTLSIKDSESWVLDLLEGVGAKAFATAKKARRVAMTFIVDVGLFGVRGKEKI